MSSDQPEQPAPAETKPKRRYRRTGLPKGRKRVRDGTTERYRSIWIPDEVLADFMMVVSAINKRKVRQHVKGRTSLNELYVEALRDWIGRAKRKLKLPAE